MTDVGCPFFTLQNWFRIVYVNFLASIVKFFGGPGSGTVFSLPSKFLFARFDVDNVKMRELGCSGRGRARTGRGPGEGWAKNGRGRGSAMGRKTLVFEGYESVSWAT